MSENELKNETAQEQSAVNENSENVKSKTPIIPKNMDKLTEIDNQLADKVDAPLKSKKGLMITCIVTFSLSLILFVLNMVFWLDSLLSDSNQQLSLVIYIITLGLWTYIPGGVLNIISLITGFSALKTQVPKERKISKIFAILSVVLIILYVIYTIFLITLRQA